MSYGERVKAPGLCGGAWLSRRSVDPEDHVGTVLHTSARAPTPDVAGQLRRCNGFTNLLLLANLIVFTASRTIPHWDLLPVLTPVQCRKGYPSILSSYAFNCPVGNSMGPPSDADGNAYDVTCAMVGFRRAVVGTQIQNWWDNGANVIAFSRGDRGFVALNLEGTTVSVDAATPLAPGTYCDALTGGLDAGACAGRSVVVDSAGRVQLDLAAGRAVAIHVGTRV